MGENSWSSRRKGSRFKVRSKRRMGSRIWKFEFSDYDRSFFIMKYSFFSIMNTRKRPVCPSQIGCVGKPFMGHITYIIVKVMYLCRVILRVFS